MAYSNYALEYQKQAANVASPVGLVVMLYDGALKFMEQGKAAMIRNDLPAQNQNLQRAQKIVFHLMATLDMEKGGEISANLMSLYNYVIERLVSANVHDKTSFVEDAIRTFTELRGGWADLDEKLKNERTSELIAA